jgi:hypothetical protein
MNTTHVRRMSGQQKEYDMSEEAPAIVGIAALAIDCADPLELARWWSRSHSIGFSGKPMGLR